MRVFELVHDDGVLLAVEVVVELGALLCDFVLFDSEARCLQVLQVLAHCERKRNDEHLVDGHGQHLAIGRYLALKLWGQELPHRIEGPSLVPGLRVDSEQKNGGLDQKGPPKGVQRQGHDGYVVHNVLELKFVFVAAENARQPVVVDEDAAERVHNVERIEAHDTHGRALLAVAH